MENPVELELEIIRRTDMGVKVWDGSKDSWLPRSQIKIEEDGSNIATITMPEWLAFKEGLI